MGFLVSRVSDAELRAAAHYWDRALDNMQRLLTLMPESDMRRRLERAMQLLTASYQLFVEQMGPRPKTPDVSELETTRLDPQQAALYASAPYHVACCECGKRLQITDTIHQFLGKAYCHDCWQQSGERGNEAQEV